MGNQLPVTSNQLSVISNLLPGNPPPPIVPPLPSGEAGAENFQELPLDNSCCVCYNLSGW